MPRTNLKARKVWREAFTAVLAYFHEGRRQATISYGGFYSNLGAQKGKSTSSARPSGPSESDFNCDLVIAARTTLTPEQLEYFNTYYLAADGSTATQKELNRNISERLGKVFIERQLWPTSLYFFGRNAK
jgi:hypothetical protein